MNVVQDPDELVVLFQADRPTHLYGLADLEEPFWSHSTWYRDGAAALGLVSAGDEWTTGYAMSQTNQKATLDLLTRVQPALPTASSVSGPIGTYEAISQVRSTKSLGTHWRMVLSTPVQVHGSSVPIPLTMDDLQDVLDLHASDRDSSFFLPMMLENYPFVGIWQDGRLVASAGTHVASRHHGVGCSGCGDHPAIS